MTAPTLTRPEPVMVTIGRRPPEATASTLPIPVTPPAIADNEFRVIADVDGEVVETAGCSCNASDDQPY
ncbi:hypothetical protein [Streptomyces canus]|uniref:hypothetical protein n=1 Tax=Streptomyces canus TaxID=58343 RepID=UPI0027852AA6|nr:hypothetical protein [Streptomyces canus]MDQ0761948.1 hypothetical protein [Streptomyces canus]